MKMPTVVFTTSVIHFPTRAGAELRIENCIKALSKVSTLHIVCRLAANNTGGPAAVSHYQQYADSVSFTPRQMHGSAASTLDDEQEYLTNLAQRVGADVIWLGYGNISYPLLKQLKEKTRCKVVVDTDSVWSRFLKRGMPFEKNPERRANIEHSGKLKEEEERWGTQLADVTTAVSDIDADYYRGLTEDPKRVHIFPNVIDPECYYPVPPPAEFRRPCVYLSGWFGHASPMEDAANWFIEEIWPTVHKAVPAAHFYVVGRDSDAVLSHVKDPSISITGSVHSVLPYLANVDVVVVPLRFESGTRYKILEAAMCSRPVVSTTLGAEGLDLHSGRDCLVADKPVQFADAIVTLLNDELLSKELAKNLKQLVSTEYTVESLAKSAEGILNYLLHD
jgi:glycosyltransferase involved in cell wall biosynthesis